MTARILPLLLALPFSFAALAQDKPAAEEKPAPVSSVKAEQQWEAEAHTTDCSKTPNRTLMGDCARIHSEIRTINLNNTTSQNEANDILVALRNMADPATKLMLLTSQNAITIQTYPEDQARLEAYVRSIDRPHHSFKLTFTLVDSDAGKRLGIQHYSMAVVSGQRATMKEGSKVPVVTGTSSKDGSGPLSQFQYLDVGIGLDATLTQFGPNLQLKTKVEQSSSAEDKTISGVAEPVIRQSVFEGVATLSPGKPTTLGSIDVPGTTRRMDIEVVAEPLP